MTDLSEYGESKRWAERPRPFTEIRQRVPCLASPSGRHGVTMTFAEDGTLVGITSDCEQHERGAAYAAGRLSRQTCGYPLRLARDYMNGAFDDDEVGEPDDEDDEDDEGSEDDEDAKPPKPMAVLQRLFFPVIETLTYARERTQERAAANHQHEPECWTRDSHAGEVWSRRVNKILPAHSEITIVVHKGVPIEAKYRHTVIARRRKRTGWVLAGKGLKRVAADMGIDTGYRGGKCHVCTPTKGRSAGRPVNFARGANLSLHRHSAKHLERLELVLVDALGSIPGCGGRLR